MPKQPVTAPVSAPVPVAPKEKKLRLMAEDHFSDGNLREFFEQYGYACEWPRNEVREIPRWLAERVIQSGGNLTPA